MANPVQLGALSLSPPKQHVPMRVRQDRPAWGVSGKGFFDDKDKLWQPGQALYFDGEPNNDLVPLNKLAFEKKQQFLDKIDDLGFKAAKKQNREYVPLSRDIWAEDGEDVEIPSPEFVMGVKREGNNEAIR